MIESIRQPLISASSACAILLLTLMTCGCGGMRQAQLRDDTGRSTHTVPVHQRIPVTVGNITASQDIPGPLRDAVSRYLLTVTAAELDRHGVFILVDAEPEPGLLAEYGFADAQSGETLTPQAALDVYIESLDEKLGATVKIAFVSSQQKHADVALRVVLRNIEGGIDLTSSQQGRSSKGAWGVIATVERDAMREGRGAWGLDGSMIGAACAEAVRLGIDDVARQLTFRANVLDAGIEKRLVRPRTNRIR